MNKTMTIAAKAWKSCRYSFPPNLMNNSRKTFVSSSSQQRQSNTHSIGIVDPYDPSLEYKPWYVNMTRRVISSLRDIQAMAVMQKQIGRFKFKDFKEEAFQVYCQVNEAFAAGNKNKLFQCTTPLAFKDFCVALDGRPPLEKHVWKLGKLLGCDIVRTRVFRWRSGNKRDICAQITLRMSLSRALGVYNGKGERIFGDADKMENVTEYIVFQRSLYLLKDFSWKYVGRIQQFIKE